MRTIHVNDIELYAHHGCLDEEERIGAKYKVNVIVGLNFLDAAHEDDLSQTIDYVDVANIVKEEMAIRSKLIESVLERIVNRIKSELRPAGLRVELYKFAPPIHTTVSSVMVCYDDLNT